MEVSEAEARYLVAVRRRPAALEALPDDWDVIELAARATIQSGIAKNANAAVRDPVTVPYLRVANVQDGYLDLRDISTIDIERSELNRYAVLQGDVLMNEGGDLDKLGRGALWLGQINPCVHQNHVFVVRCKPGLVPEYLNAWTSTARARRYFMLAGRQTTNLASINKTSLGELTVAVPPTEHEQRSIANAVGDTDALIDSLEHLLTKKREIKQGAMQELLTGKRRLPEFTKAWSCNELRKLVRIPVTDGPHTTPIFVEAGVPFLSVNNLVGSRIDFTDLRFITKEDDQLFARKCKPRRGDVLLGKAASVGKVAIVEDDLDFNIWSPIALIRSVEELDSRFLYYQLQSRSVTTQISVLTNSSSQGNLGMGDIERLQIAHPCVDEQREIAAVLSDMDAEITTLESRLTKARALKQAMAQALLTGRIRLVKEEAAA
jgi:type I restriction enzyme S subunit